MKLQRQETPIAVIVHRLVFALTIYPTKAQAQIIGQLDVNVPFQFHAGTLNFRRANTLSTCWMIPT